LRYRFISAGDFIHNRLLIEGKGEGPANSDILKRGSGYVEAIKVGSKKWARMEIGSTTEMGKNERGDQALIQKQVGLAGGV
jgi:hypothetical protein